MPPRFARLAALAAVSIASSCTPAAKPVTAPQATSWRDVSHAAKVARDAGDYAAYRANVITLEALLSGHPDVVVSRAGAEARLGHRDAAIGALRTVAAMGVVVDLDAETDLASLRDDPRFAELKRQIASNKREMGRATRLFDLPSDGLIPEDVAYDEAAHAYLVSSVRHRKILVVGDDGEPHDFAANLPFGAFAVKYDAARETVWATIAAVPQTVGYRKEDAGQTAVLAFDRKTAALKARIDLHAAGSKHALGDAALGSRGELYVSDGGGGGVYVVQSGGRALETLVPEGTLASPQTPATTADGARLFVPDYVRGIAIVDLGSHALTWLAHDATVAVNGIDGVCFASGALVAIQNGTTPPRIVRYTLDASQTRIARVEVLAQAADGFGEPTHGVVEGGAFRFIANAGWPRFDDDGALKPDAPADAPAIWSLPLK